MRESKVNSGGPIDNGGLGVEPGYLNRERLSSEEIASIETVLEAASRTRAPRRPAGWLGLAAAAAMLALFAFILARMPSQSIEDSPRPTAAAAAPRAMVLEIRRTDVAGSKPYTLIIQVEPDPPRVDPEVTP